MANELVGMATDAVTSFLLSWFGHATTTTATTAKPLPSKEIQPLGTYLVYLVFFAILYFFSSPFMGNQDLRSATVHPYVTLAVILHSWLALATLVHLPIVSAAALVPLSLFMPIFLVTLFALAVLELALKAFNSRYRSHVGPTRAAIDALFNALIISAVCCFAYGTCGPTLEGVNVNDHLCQMLYSSMPQRNNPFQALPLIVLWVTLIALVIVHYAFEKLLDLSAIVSIGFSSPSQSSSQLAAPPSAAAAAAAAASPDTKYVEQLGMVNWYSMLTTYTAVDLVISLKLFLGRFDIRALLAALEPNNHFDHLKNREELWFDWMADCGDGFNSTYAVARALAAPSLTVARDDGSSLTLPRGKALFIGGDMGYPTPSAYESRFFNVYEAAMPPPPHYHMDHLSTHKPDIPIPLHRYPGVEAYLIPGNHDYLDGLQAFVEKILHRDWLGGWLLPQRHSYWAKRLPHNWWMFGLDIGIEGDIDPLQFRYFVDLAKAEFHEGEHHRVILAAHIPEWIFDHYEGHSTAKNLKQLVRILGGRVRLRICGDVHNYQRHVPLLSFGRTAGRNRRLSLSRTTNHSSTTTAAAAASPVSASAASPVSASAASPVSAVADSDDDNEDDEEEDDIMCLPPTAVSRSRSVSVLSLLSAPSQEKAPSQTSKKEKPQLPSSPHHNDSLFLPFVDDPKPPVLVISGGGGAFMHPTHSPETNMLLVDREPYQKVASYPSDTDSRAYALLNVFGFRRRNWVFDLFSGGMYFLLMSSLFPLCNLQHIVMAPSYLEMVLQFWRTVVLVYAEIFTSFFSLCGWVLLLVASIAFTESNWPPWRRCVVGTLLTVLHGAAAVGIVVFLEALLEAGIAYRLIGHSEFSIYQLFVDEFPSIRLPVHMLDAIITFCVSMVAEPHPEGYVERSLSLFFSIFDIPDSIAFLKQAYCKTLSQSRLSMQLPDMISSAGLAIPMALSRFQSIAYYSGIFLYSFPIATPFASFIFGSYLFLNVNYLDSHWNEAFSALRIESFKSFLRIHIKPENGDLEIFCLGIDKCPKAWRDNPQWSGRRHQAKRDAIRRKREESRFHSRWWYLEGGRGKNKQRLGEENPSLSCTWPQPSRFSPQEGEPEAMRLVDYFVVKK